MPFMIGLAPIRRTVKYLDAGKLYFRDRVKIFSVNYNIQGDHHKGARDFVFWHLPQVQYKNPNVQCVTFKDLTPTPFITCYFDGGEKMIIDVDSKNKEDILNHLVKVVGKSEKKLKEEAIAQIENPANFGYQCARHCMCEILGQVPCPRIVPLPKVMRGKYIYGKED